MRSWHFRPRSERMCRRGRFAVGWILGWQKRVQDPLLPLHGLSSSNKFKL